MNVSGTRVDWGLGGVGVPNAVAADEFAAAVGFLGLGGETVVFVAAVPDLVHVCHQVPAWAGSIGGCGRGYAEAGVGLLWRLQDAEEVGGRGVVDRWVERLVEETTGKVTPAQDCVLGFSIIAKEHRVEAVERWYVVVSSVKLVIVHLIHGNIHRILPGINLIAESIRALRLLRRAIMRRLRRGAAGAVGVGVPLARGARARRSSIAGGATSVELEDTI